MMADNAVGIGLSLDGPVAAAADRTRRGWSGDSAFDATIRAIEKLDGYSGFNVICTMTRENLQHLTHMVDFLHAARIPACMLNVTRFRGPARCAARILMCRALS